MPVRIRLPRDSLLRPSTGRTPTVGYTEFDLRNKLLAIPGVSQVSAIGDELPEYQINVKQDRLALYGLTVQDVVEAARESHSTASAVGIGSLS